MSSDRDRIFLGGGKVVADKFTDLEKIVNTLKEAYDVFVSVNPKSTVEQRIAKIWLLTPGINRGKTPKTAIQLRHALVRSVSDHPYYTIRSLIFCILNSSVNIPFTETSRVVDEALFKMLNLAAIYYVISTHGYPLKSVVKINPFIYYSKKKLLWEKLVIADELYDDNKTRQLLFYIWHMDLSWLSKNISHDIKDIFDQMIYIIRGVFGNANHAPLKFEPDKKLQSYVPIWHNYLSFFHKHFIHNKYADKTIRLVISSKLDLTRKINSMNKIIEKKIDELE